jgi:hypothetical protein
MHAWPGKMQRGPGSKIALTLFVGCGLAGLLAGFALAGFVGRGAGELVGGLAATRTQLPVRPFASPQQTQQPAVLLAVPQMHAGDYTSQEKADGTTPYRLLARIVTKSGTVLSARDVTCRLWLSDNAVATSAALSKQNYAILRTLSAFGQPFPHEIAHALLFAPASQQTQFCASQGPSIWIYALAPTLPGGRYFLVVLADWQGIHYNWSMVAISVTGGNAH